MASKASNVVAKPEWSALLECASPDREPRRLQELLRAVSWPALVNLADEHGVIAQLSASVAAAGGVIPAESAQRARELYRAQVLSSLQMTAELFRLIETFRAASLETVLVKGPALAVRAYGDAGARQYGDLDFLVRHRDIGRARELMISAGYQANVPAAAIRAEKIPGQYTFLRMPAPLLVELHTERTMRYFPRGLPIEEFFARRQPVNLDGHEIPTLAMEDELVLICIHGAKHLWERLTLIADVAAFTARQATLNYDASFGTARRIGAERMLGTGLLLAGTLLRAPLPPSVDARVRADSSTSSLVAQISDWLPSAGRAMPGVLSRAVYRMRMRGDTFSALTYLLRLTFSPTQEDWGDPSEGKNSGELLAPLRRTFRLAKKYRR